MWVIGAALCAVIIAIAVRKAPVQAPQTVRSVQAPEHDPRRLEVAAADPSTSVSPQNAPDSEAATALADQAEEAAAVFRASPTGELIIDEKTRINMEELIAQSGLERLFDAVQEQTQHLPPVAARQAEELAQKFVQYQQAQRQTYPPSETSVTEDDAIRELEGLHALREVHFGTEIARGLYGREEAIAREMIEVMRIENDASLTTEEKLARAQALRERLPNVAAIEKNNRDAAAPKDQDED
jgi:hypothetical protein